MGFSTISGGGGGGGPYGTREGKEHMLKHKQDHHYPKTNIIRHYEYHLPVQKDRIVVQA